VEGRKGSTHSGANELSAIKRSHYAPPWPYLFRISVMDAIVVNFKALLSFIGPNSPFRTCRSSVHPAAPLVFPSAAARTWIIAVRARHN